MSQRRRRKIKNKYKINKRFVILIIIIIAAVVIAGCAIASSGGANTPQGSASATPSPSMPQESVAAKTTQSAPASTKPAASPSPSPTVSPSASLATKPKKMIALTFDDGPSSKTTPEILAVLKENGAKATFFMLGQMVENNPKIAKQVIADGHEIGNHSYSHKNLTKLSSSAIEKEVQKCQDIIYDATGEYPTLMRPPYGSIDEDVYKYTKMPLILWSMDTLDWKVKDGDEICDAIMDGVSDNAIILLHDIHEETVDAVKKVIPKLSAAGWQMVTVSELFAAQEIPLVKDAKYFFAAKGGYRGPAIPKETDETDSLPSESINE